MDPELGYGEVDKLVFTAAPGEANMVVLEWKEPSETLLIRDAGSLITPGERCVRDDEHTVRCTGNTGVRGLSDVMFDLGDGNDEFRNNGGRTTFVIADGGPGDDRLVGGSGSDRLVGGGGRDQLFGAGGPDELSDGDLNGALLGAGIDGDRLDGGSGGNTLSYRQRTGGVEVDLAVAATGEGDVLAGIRNVIGGRGDDRLAGDDKPNFLDGGPGLDRLEARGGGDDLRNGESTSCGSGVDLSWGHTFDAPRRPDDLGLLERDCEHFFVERILLRAQSAAVALGSRLPDLHLPAERG